jgi:protocatechuate 4,5-dioxygenase, alpha chain
MSQPPHPTVPGRPDFDDIPGTTVFDGYRSRQGFHLNQFCMSLMKPANRQRFHAGERAYLDEWPMSEQQKQAVLHRDFQRMLDLGGNVYFLSKIFASDGLSYVQAVATMTELSVEEYQAMMLAGGRSIEGWRSVSERP